MQQYGQAQQIQANAMAMRQARNENALAQQAAVDKQVFSKIMADSVDPNTGAVNYQTAALLAAKLAPGRVPELNAARVKTEADTQEADKNRISNIVSAMDLRRRALEGISTVDDFIMWHDQNHKDPIIGPYLASIGSTREQAMARIEAARNNPAVFARLLQESKIGTEKTQAALDAQANRDTQLEVQGMIGERMANRPVGRAAAPARAATGGAAPAAAGTPAASGKPGRAGKAPPNPALVAAAQDQKIARIRAIIKEADELADFGETGIVGETMARVGGTKARTLAGKISTLKGNLGFDQLQQMREASPTGGALGQVAVKELERLESTIASLDQGLSEKDLKESLKKVEQHYNAWYEAVVKARSATPAAAGTTTGASPEKPSLDDIFKVKK